MSKQDATSDRIKITLHYAGDYTQMKDSKEISEILKKNPNLNYIHLNADINKVTLSIESPFIQNLWKIPKTLENNPDVNSIDISNHRLDTEAIGQFAHLFCYIDPNYHSIANIKTINFSNNHDITDKSIKIFLQELYHSKCNAQSLNFDNCSLSNNGIAYIMSAKLDGTFPNLYTVRLNNNDYIAEPSKINIPVQNPYIENHSLFFIIDQQYHGMKIMKKLIGDHNEWYAELGTYGYTND